MKTLLLTTCFVCCLCGCNRTQTTDPSAAPSNDNPETRDVIFKSHLAGDLNADPIIQCGEKLRVIPDATEPMASNASIVVQLPQQTPYQGNDELYYLRGFAIGQMSVCNQQFL